jgi:hypothetical protein
MSASTNPLRMTPFLKRIAFEPQSSQTPASVQNQKILGVSLLNVRRNFPTRKWCVAQK